MRSRAISRLALGITATLATLSVTGLASADQSDLQQTMPLVYVLTVLSVIGAGATYAFLVYALWRFRDPKTRGRRYG
ncbi:MAG: hypothetical protein L3K09_02480 [Thermoplasmata archaeon]|nr:hypothetical protein [Thermoplasmata archaeon]